MTTKFEPHEHVIFVQSMKIGTHIIKAIHSISLLISLTKTENTCTGIHVFRFIMSMNQRKAVQSRSLHGE